MPWAHSVEWDAQEIRVTLTRGDLQLTRGLRHGGPPPDAWADLEDDGPWWTPVTKKWADELARRLAHFAFLTWLPLRRADETGRLHVTVWRDAEGRYRATEAPGAEAVRLVLEPGLVVERADSTDVDRAQVRRMFEPQGMTVGEALELGWAHVEASDGVHRSVG